MKASVGEGIRGKLDMTLISYLYPLDYEDSEQIYIQKDVCFKISFLSEVNFEDLLA
jgi:hypothetical protein